MISVVIPAFNVEKYIEECLQSIIWQTYDDLEIICINDGSNDETQRILEKFARLDPRVKVVIQGNKSVSCARNLGLKYATSEYITFVDSDDVIGRDYMKTLWENRNKADCVMVNMKRISTEVPLDQSELEWYKRYNLSDKTGLYKVNPLFMTRVFMTCWGKLFKKSIIEKYKMKFYEGVIHEDNAWCYEYVAHCKNLYYVNKILYNYRKRVGSLTYNILVDKNKTSKKKNKNFYDIVKVYIHIAKHFKKYGLLQKYRRALLVMISKNEYQLSAISRSGFKGIRYLKKFTKFIGINYKQLINMLSFAKLRIYIQNLESKDKIKLLSYDKKFKLSEDKYLEKRNGFGYVVSTKTMNVKFSFSTSYTGKVYFWFHPVKELINKARLKSFKVNGEEFISKKIYCSEDKPYTSFLEVIENEPIEVEINVEDK